MHMLLRRFDSNMTILLFFFFNDTATPEIYTLSLHDALPILNGEVPGSYAPPELVALAGFSMTTLVCPAEGEIVRSEEHTSELQSQSNLVCRLLLEKKKKIMHVIPILTHSEK